MKTVGEVVAWIDSGAHFAAVRAEEAKVAFAQFGRRPDATERADRHGPGQDLAQAAQKFNANHGLLQKDGLSRERLVVEDVGFLLPVEVARERD